MDKKDIEKIITDYDFACKVAERYGYKGITHLFSIFEMLEYHSYNLCGDELFDMEIGDLTLTYVKDYNGIEPNIQVWENEEWQNTTIDELRKKLKELENE